MALISNFEFNGVEISNAYIKVENAVVQKDNIMATVVWRSSQNSTPLKNMAYGFEYDIDGKNPLAQVYDQLKALPEFEGATDA